MNVRQFKFGHYRLESLLGSSSIGETWRAWDLRKDRQIALKLLASCFTKETDCVKRFRREVALAARLSGPHIVPIYDYGEIDGRLYIEMPLIGGADLATLLKSGPLPVHRAVEIVTQIADSLDLAHRAGLVHLNVKPSNVLVSDGGGRDVVYLTDFGVANAVHGTKLAQSGAMIGTPTYMAPEQFETVGDHRSDIYALARVLQEELTGQPPSNNINLVGLIKPHHDATLRAVVPPGLTDVIARSMAEKPDDRHPSALALVAEAQQALHGSPGRITEPDLVESPAPSETGSRLTWAPRRRALRRRVVVAALCGSAVLVITSGIIVSQTGRAVTGTQTPAASTPTKPAVVAKIPVRVAPRDLSVPPGDLAISPDGARLYVTSGPLGTISVIDTASRAVVDTIAVDGAQDIALTSDGGKAYVGTYSGLVSLNLATKTQRAIPLVKGHGQSVAIAPNGRRVYVATYDGRSIAVVDTASEQMIANVPVGRTAMDVAISPDGSTVYAAVFDYNAIGTNTDYGNISVIDAARATITMTIATPPQPGRNFVTVSRNGSALYTDGGSSSQIPSLEVLNAQSGTVSGYIAVGVNNPIIRALSRDGKIAYVTEAASKDLFVVDTVSRTLSRTIPLDTLPTSVALDPTGRIAYVATYGVSHSVVGAAPASTSGFVYVIALS